MATLSLEQGVLELGQLGEGDFPVLGLVRRRPGIDLHPEDLVALEDDPVELGQVRREPADLLGRQLVDQDGNDALVVLESQLDLVPAHLRADRVAADEEHEDVGALDRLGDLLPPPLPYRNPLPVDPGVDLALLEGLAEQARERDVATRIGDEDVGHVPAPIPGRATLERSPGRERGRVATGR